MIKVNGKPRKAITIASGTDTSLVDCVSNDTTRRYDCYVSNVKGSTDDVAYITGASGVTIDHAALARVEPVSSTPKNFMVSIVDGTRCMIGPMDSFSCKKKYHARSRPA